MLGAREGDKAERPHLPSAAEQAQSSAFSVPSAAGCTAVTVGAGVPASDFQPSPSHQIGYNDRGEFGCSPQHAL